MNEAKGLADKLARGEVLILDGAVGTQLQEMGVPMDNTAWAAAGLRDYPYTVRRMHELYVNAGVDILTTNTYSSARHNLEPLGLGDLTGELNLRAVMLAQDARDRAAHRRPIWIAGAISGFGLVIGGEPRRALHRYARPRSVITAEQARANIKEQAEILAEAGVDLLLVEATGSDEHRKWIIDACKPTGLPVWVGFKCRRDADDPTVKTGYSVNTPLAESVKSVMAHGGSLVTVFHSSIGDTTAAIASVRQHWDGPIGLYPEAERSDYTATWHDSSVPNKVSPAQFLEVARGWVEQGIQVIGGCCGIGVPYVQLLRDGLPASVPGKKRQKETKRLRRAR
jgi:S-methylmethionine-dependent homocysteine/selenocysteine methylase